MNEVLMTLTIAYVFLVAIVLLAVVYGKLPLSIRGLVVLACGVFFWLSYQGWNQAQGWPSPSAFPSKFLLHAAVIEEPDADLGLKGRIFVWASDLEDDQPADTPRAYELAYDQRLHSELAQAIRKMRNGNLQIGEVGGELNDPQATRDESRIADKKLELKFTDLPDPQLPEK